MKKDIKILLEEYENSVNVLTKQFIEKYYCDEDIDIDDVDMYWIGDAVGEIVFINDNYWNFNNIVEALKMDYPKDKLFDWYEYSYDQAMEGKPGLTMKNFLTFGK